MDEILTYTAFVDEKSVASGPLDVMLPQLKTCFDQDARPLILIFEDQTGRQVDFDLRGTLKEVLERALPQTHIGPGRPKLGVVSREVSLLPRHWDWLQDQPNGASASLRRLVDEAKNRERGKHRARLAMDATSLFMTAMAGNLPGYEEATRALYAADHDRFDSLIGDWPQDIRVYIQRLTQNVFHAKKTVT